MIETLSNYGKLNFFPPIQHRITSRIPKYLKITVYLNAIFAVNSLETGIFGHEMDINESTLTYLCILKI